MFLKVKKFFLENTRIKQTIIKNTFWLTLAEAISKFLKLILIIYVARILGAAEYGKFTFALAFVSLFVIFSDFGLGPIITREFSRQKEKVEDFSAILSLKIILSIGTLILIFLGSFFITSNPDIRSIIWILAVFIVIDSFPQIIYAFSRARQRMEYESLARIFQVLAITAAGFFVILRFPSVRNLSFAYLFAGLGALFVILFVFHFKFFSLRFSLKPSIWKRFLAMSWPLALAGIFSTIYSQIDLVMLGHWGQITQAGWYGASYRIIGMTLIPGVLISQSFFPVLSIFFKESKEKLQKTFDKFMEVMMFLSIPLVVGGITLAPKIIDWIYDPSYLPAVWAFQILLVMVAITYLFCPLSSILVAANQQKKAFWIALVGAIVNIILNLILIPKFSLYGAAWATLITYVILLLLILAIVARSRLVQIVGLKFFSTILGITGASALMYFVITLPVIYGLNVVLAVLIGAGVYLLSFLLYKELLERFNVIKIFQKNEQ
jgi:O-antigen/teichoic acid export membrane protein